MDFTIEEIAKATDAQLIKSAKLSKTFSLSTDSRNITNEQIYLPIKGEKFDGLDFVADALRNGARGYFTTDKTLIFDEAHFILYVEDTKEAYLKLANYYRNKISPITIAITGSSGKTTTKEMMYSIASEKFKAHKSKLNYNNEIGLCQTLLSMPEDTEVLIVEMGMRGLQEIELLSKYAEPDIAIIANIGPAHIGRLGSMKNIAKAKCEIIKYLHQEGTLIALEDDLIKCDNKFAGKTIYFSLNSPYLKVNELTSKSSKFSYKNQEYKLNLEGEHNIQNSLAAIEAGLLMGMNSILIAKGLAKFKPIEKRWELQKIKGLNIINDSYNANPDSVKAAVKTFLRLYDNPKVLVLGDMGELGKNEKKYHAEIGEFLKDYDYDFLITVGKLAKNIKNDRQVPTKNFASTKDAAKYLIKNVKTGSNILLKASRSMKFEEIIEELKKI